MACRSDPSRSQPTIGPGELALCGVMGAMGLLLPVVMHALRIWPVFMPMHLPIMTLAFLVRPLPAATTAAIVPLASGILTGMPPFYPPLAIWMSCELACMAGLASLVYKVLPWAHRAIYGRSLILAFAMIVGRLLYMGMVYAFSLVMQLPAGLLTGLSFITGWPGMILMLIAIPPAVVLVERSARRPLA
ncbi:MAG: hypothetical protein QHH07_01090 [Sedimentisphaerales bacterium]|nr:hypothetical protein [Sedimentisphaerales bacterium]